VHGPARPWIVVAAPARPRGHCPVRAAGTARLNPSCWKRLPDIRHRDRHAHVHDDQDSKDTVTKEIEDAPPRPTTPMPLASPVFRQKPTFSPASLDLQQGASPMSRTLILSIGDPHRGSRQKVHIDIGDDGKVSAATMHVLEIPRLRAFRAGDAGRADAHHHHAHLRHLSSCSSLGLAKCLDKIFSAPRRKPRCCCASCSIAAA